MRHITIAGLLALGACAMPGPEDFNDNSLHFHLHAPQHSPVEIAECVTTALDSIEYGRFDHSIQVTRRSTQGSGKTIELYSGVWNSPRLIQWMAWIRQDSTVEIKVRYEKDLLLETFQTCTGQLPVPS